MSFFRSRTSKPMVPDPIPVDKPPRRSQANPSHPAPPPSSSANVPPPPRSQYQPPSGHPPPPPASSGPPPPPRSAQTPQQQRLSTLARLAAQLDSLTRSFVIPHVLAFDPSATPDQPKLTFDTVNKPVHELDDGLTKLLLALDGVESEGDEVVRDERKRLVKAVNAETEKLDRARREAFERQSANGTLSGPVGGVPAAGGAVEGQDRVGELRNGGTPARGGVPPPPRAADGTEARIYQHKGPEHHWNDSPPVILNRRNPTDSPDQPTSVRNKRASMRRPPPTNFF